MPGRGDVRHPFGASHLGRSGGLGWCCVSGCAVALGGVRRRAVLSRWVVLRVGVRCSVGALVGPPGEQVRGVLRRWVLAWPWVRCGLGLRFGLVRVCCFAAS